MKSARNSPHSTASHPGTASGLLIIGLTCAFFLWAAITGADPGLILQKWLFLSLFAVLAGAGLLFLLALIKRLLSL